VPKVGPKSAWQIMNQATPALLVEAAQKNDPGYLQKLSGIGKKTCENIVQHLAQKVEHLPSVGATHTELSATQTDAIDALISLGYDATAAREIVLEISTPDATVNSIITVALKRIT
jgi:Holliday junction DNA helicase RuvA